ncbi:hypothetical protein PDE_06735 [Penicillium oxalicum 114-2]|uniref:Uncharacterized protein n=1 Tax=Penicillium oxalicum (strain 114-2 / CGMCC 5302) TaxID=933388 RepID=S8BAG4_PENO1|nr:hypothetical protein PDE_06735 [Penicillium oxalicum 114-2]
MPPDRAEADRPLSREDRLFWGRIADLKSASRDEYGLITPDEPLNGGLKLAVMHDPPLQSETRCSCRRRSADFCDERHNETHREDADSWSSGPSPIPERKEKATQGDDGVFPSSVEGVEVVTYYSPAYFGNGVRLGPISSACV